jgi:hypothetical protein
MNAHSEAAIYGRGGEAGIAIPVFAQSMQNLDNAGRIIVRLPGLHMNAMAVLRRQLMLLVM